MFLTSVLPLSHGKFFSQIYYFVPKMIPKHLAVPLVAAAEHMGEFTVAFASKPVRLIIHSFLVSILLFWTPRSRRGCR